MQFLPSEEAASQDIHLLWTGLRTPDFIVSTPVWDGTDKKRIEKATNLTFKAWNSRCATGHAIPEDLQKIEIVWTILSFRGAASWPVPFVYCGY